MNSEAIYVYRPFNTRQVCVKIPYRGIEISMAADDSCGALEHLSRTDIRLYAENGVGKDMTEKIMGTQNIYRVSAETLKEVFHKIDEFCVNN